MNPYHHFVTEHARLIAEGLRYPLGGFPPRPRPEIRNDAPKGLIFSPHPDDEVIIGALALRLMREANWRVINVAVTHGSKKERQAERLHELKGCCDCIGFELLQTAPSGLEKVTLDTRKADPKHWGSSVEVIASILANQQPKVILFPHELDWNSAHIGTHWLVMDALKEMAPSFSCFTLETEFWGQNQSPNLMVELSAEHAADLITALTFHVKEVQRNPYHLTMPAGLIDNVRRGAELVGGQGGVAPKFDFAVLYRLRRWSNGALAETLQQGRFLPCDENAARLFE